MVRVVKKESCGWIVKNCRKFINMNGINIVLNCYQQALEKHDERVANKAAVIIVGIGFDIGFQGYIEYPLLLNYIKWNFTKEIF